MTRINGTPVPATSVAVMPRSPLKVRTRAGAPSAALLAVGLLTLGCRAGGGEPTVPQPPSGEVWLTDQQVTDGHIAVQPVGVHAVGNDVVTSGRVTFDDLRVAHIYSPVTGRVSRILADPGQRVKKGGPLCAIQSPDVGNAFADLGKAEAELTASQHDFQRQKELYEAHAGSQKDFETAEDNYGKAKAELERSRQKARLFRRGDTDTVTQEFVLRAPIEGEVIARSVNPGAEVQGQYSGGAAQELFTVGELDRVWVLAEVFEMDLARVKKGAKVTTRVVAYPNEVFTGVVDWISDLLDPTARTARVRCEVENPRRELKPEMYATVTIAVPGVQALAVPLTAILRLADQTIVFVEQGSAPDGRRRFVRRVVAAGDDEGTSMVPVAQGLQSGERVVTSGAILLSGML
ncbi:MAG TPA: efflux RND transporter periplasmic adaptor subunit [Polyangia bacterium]|nr:efflux RND transporter periplasmic adaptor subunit [Polyangia bacterium]